MKRWLVFLSLMSIQLVCTADAGAIDLPVYTQKRTVDEYIYKKDLPAMTQSTLCLWISAAADDDDYNMAHLFSISTPSNQNAYTFGFSTQPLVFIDGTQLNFDVYTADISYLLVGWHKHCFTWKSGDTIKWYAEKNNIGEMELLTSASIPVSTIEAGGALILMHEQDGFFSNLDENQATIGKVAWVNMWDYAVTDNEIKQLRCRDQGNVVTWDTLSQQGSGHVHFESFDCKGELAPLPRQHGQLQSYKTFCVVSGAMLNMTSLLEEKVDSLNRCVLRCTREVDCLSANFNKTSGVCQMLDDIDQGNEGDFVLVDDINLKYITTRECIN